MRSNNPKNKSLVEIHKDNGGYSIEFTVDRTIPEFNQGAEKCELTWIDSFTEFENVLQGQHRTAWKQVLHEHFPEPVDATRPVPSEQNRNSEENYRRALALFLQRTLNEKKPRDRQYIYLQPGGDYTFQKAMMTKPFDHLRRFEEMLRSAEALPAGDMPGPNDALQVEWFYMSFHQEDRNRYLESGRRLCDETLATVSEYFDAIYNSQMADGSLTKKREKQIEFRAKRELRHDMAKRYNDKIRHFANQRYGREERHKERGNSHRRIFDKSRSYRRDDRDTSRHFKRDDGTTRRPPSERTRFSRERPATSMGRRANIPSTSASKTLKIKTRTSMTRSATTRRTTTTSKSRRTTRGLTRVGLRPLQATAQYQAQRSKSKRKSSTMFTSIKMRREEVLGWLMCLARGRA